MKDQGEKVSQMMQDLSKLDRLAGQGINVESLKKSIKQKNDDHDRRISK